MDLVISNGAKNMKKIPIFLIFLLLFTFFLSPVYANSSYDFPNWVKKGSFVNYTIAGDLTLRYNNKYYFIWDFSKGYLYWEIKDVNGDFATLHIKLLCAYLNVGNNSNSYLPDGIIKMLKPTNKKGFVNYSAEKIIKVNYVKREVISNGGYVNLWINPAADVYYGPVPSDIQSNPNAKPFIKHSPAGYIPKYMVFPSNKSMSLGGYTFHDYDVLRVMGSSKQSELNWTNLSNSGAYAVKCVNMNNLTEYPFLVSMAYDKDTGILLSGDWFDDIYVSEFGLYSVFLVKLNKTNIFANEEEPFIVSMEGIITFSIIIVVGAAVWILWKRRK